MDTTERIWHVWVMNLQRLGIQDLVASLLEAAGPLTTIGAQAVYLGQPLLNSFLPADHLQALAHMLEDNQQTRNFTTYLREGIHL
jgi:hypothetical protein